MIKADFATDESGRIETELVGHTEEFAPELTELLAHIYRFYDEEEAEFEKTMLTIRLMLFLMIEQEKDRRLRDDSKKEEKEHTKKALKELLKQMETTR